MTTYNRVIRVGGNAKQLMKDGLKQLDAKVAKVGWFQGQKYEDGTPVAKVAAIQEYGSPQNNIPPRPFMSTSVIKHEQAWLKIMSDGAKAVLQGRATTPQVLEAVGLKAKADIQETISQIFEPPLKPATIAARLRRKSDKATVGDLTKPLIDTGYMYGTITNAVEDEQ